MRTRYSTCVGLPVLEDGTEEVLGTLSGILIHPDMGRIEGFFVRIAGFLKNEEEFVSSQDIVHWGMRIRVSHADALGPLEERVRLHTLYEEDRPVLGQKIVAEGGAILGRCQDIQFETVTFRLEWLFPKKFWRWGLSVPVTAVIEVKPEAIIVRDTLLGEDTVPAQSVLEKLAEAPVQRPLDPA
jgi:uncharacterized protein YrrD